MRLYYKILVAFLGSILIFIPSCMQLKKAEVDFRLRNTDKYLTAGEFQKAINVYKDAHKRYPEDQTILSNYIKTIEHIKNSADSSFDSEDFDSAERIYSVLLNNYPDFKGVTQFLSFDRSSLDTRINNIIEKQVLQYIAAGYFQMALDAYKTMYIENPEDKVLSRSYIKIIEYMKNTANIAFDKQDFASAGKIYSVLVDNYSDFTEFIPLLSFNSKSLKAKITDCSTSLFKKGLEQYRTGNINNAISLWESLLIFDPDNSDTKKAIETATIQLNTLQQKK